MIVGIKTEIKQGGDYFTLTNIVLLKTVGNTPYITVLIVDRKRLSMLQMMT